MGSAPPPFVVAALHRLLPPASREAVLGDLWESARTRRQFVSSGLAVLPFLIVAQVRRRSSWPVLGLQAFVLFACLRGFAPGQAAPPMWARAAVPTLLAFLALAWHDTYRATQPAHIARRLWGEAAAVAAAIALSEGAAALLAHAWLMRPSELLSAACALPVLAVLRAGSGVAAASPVPERARDLPAEYALFRAAVRRRNRLEVAAMLATLLLAGLIVARAPGAFPIPVWLTLAGFLSFACYLLLRGEAAPMPPHASALAIGSLFRHETLRQHRLRSTLVWWWFAPLFIGLGMHFLVPHAGFPGPLPATSGLLLMILLAACIHALNRERADLVAARLGSIGG